MPDSQPVSPRVRKKLSLMEAVMLFIFAVIILALIPPIRFTRVGRQSPLSVCATNLKDLGMAMSSYASQNQGSWPIAAHAPASEDGKCAVTYAPGRIGTHRGNAQDRGAGETTLTDTEMSVTRNLWTLIRENLSSPKTFICPLTTDSPNEEANPQHYWDFAQYGEVSYGMQVPYGKHGRPATKCSPRMALAADKGPFGASLEAHARPPGPPTRGISATAKEWRPWNSPNHRGKDQTVLYADGHIESQTTPLAGCMDDNIYTRWSDTTGGPGNDPDPQVRGTPPANNEAPLGDTDSLIYP